MQTATVVVFGALLASCFLETSAGSCFTQMSLTFSNGKTEANGWKNTGNCACSAAKTAAGSAPGAYVPTCTSDGKFDSAQTHISTGQFWCADKKTGNQINVFTRGGAMNC